MDYTHTHTHTYTRASIHTRMYGTHKPRLHFDGSRIDTLSIVEPLQQRHYVVHDIPERALHLSVHVHVFPQAMLLRDRKVLARI